MDSHFNHYILAQKPISITGSRLTDEQMVEKIGKKKSIILRNLLFEIESS